MPLERYRVRAAIVAGIAVASAATAAAPELPATPVRSTVTVHHGQSVADPYRWLEQVNDPEVVAWMKAQNAVTRACLDAIPGRAGILARLNELESATPARVVGVRLLRNGRVFYLRRGSAERQFKLFTRDRIGGKERLLVDPLAGAAAGESRAINFHFVSPKGSYVAYGISTGGSEATALHVIDVATGKSLIEPIDRTGFNGDGNEHWLPDESGFYFNRWQEPRPGMRQDELWLNSRVYFLPLKSGRPEAAPVFGVGSRSHESGEARLSEIDEPFVFQRPGSRWTLGRTNQGVRSEFSLFAARNDRVHKAGAKATPWRRVFGVDDNVTLVDVRGDHLYFLTHTAAPRYQLRQLDLARPEKPSESVMPQQGGAVITDFRVARDALYVSLRAGAQGRLVRIPFTERGFGRTQEIALPFPASVTMSQTDPEAAGALVQLAGWTRARGYFRVGRDGKLKAVDLQPAGPFDAPKDFVTRQVLISSHDGTAVPLTLIHRQDLQADGRAATILTGYGAYGISVDPNFSHSWQTWVERGGVVAVAHIRGGGELGKEWHLAGKEATKSNTWKDLIAAAEWLIAEKITTPKRLAISGGSAGGILVGRAMTERPDLFAAAVPVVGALDMLRMEFTTNGPSNIPEFGTVKTEQGFKALLAMSAYHQVRDDTSYPAVLLPHGVNDPRVDVWTSLKFAARVQAATKSGKPVLLALDFAAGHGIGNTREQRLNQAADMMSFILWQMNEPGFQPLP